MHVCSRYHGGPCSYERSISGERVCLMLQTALRYAFSPLLLFREPWPQAGVCAFSGLREGELCVRLSPGYTQDKGALPLSNNSLALAFWGGGGVGLKGIKEGGKRVCSKTRGCLQ